MKASTIIIVALLSIGCSFAGKSDDKWSYRQALYDSRSFDELKSNLILDVNHSDMKWYVSNAFETRFRSRLNIQKKSIEYRNANASLEKLLRADSSYVSAVIGLEWRLANYYSIFPGRTDLPDQTSSGELTGADGTKTKVPIHIYNSVDPRMRTLATEMMSPHLSSGQDWVEYYYCWGKVKPGERIDATIKFDGKISDPLVRYALLVCGSGSV